MDFDKYKKLVTYYWKNDNRELNIQNRIIIPFLESILPYDIVDTSTIYKGKKDAIRNEFAGENYSPDIVIVKNWLWNRGEDEHLVKDKPIYKAIIEVKTLANKERKQSQKQVKKYLTKVPIVILTDALMWEISFDDSRKTIKISLEMEQTVPHKGKVYEFPADVCSRNFQLDDLKFNADEWRNLKNTLKKLLS